MTRLAHHSKNIAHFFNDGSMPAASGHATQFYLDSKNARTRWVLKQFEKGELAQIEAGMAALYNAMAKPDMIPTVYAVYRKSEDTLPQVFASVSTVFSEFQDLKTYLSSGLNEEKLSFLIENGFPEICVLSYFLEEDDLHKGNIGISDGRVVRIDFDMSAFSIVGKPDFRGSRSSLDSRRLEDMFVITAKDIEHFPELTDAKPYYFPTIFRMMASSSGYTADEVKNLSALQKNPRFIKHAYLMFLKIISLPEDVFNKLFSIHIGDPELVSKLSGHFIRRKQILREVLLSKNECLKFKNFLETLSAEEIRSIFQEINQHNIKNKFEFQQIDLNITQSNFYHFIYDSVKAGDLFRFLDITAHLAENFSQDVLSVLKRARGHLLYYYQWLIEKKLLLLEDIVLFVKEMKNNLDVMKALFDPPNQQIDALHTNISVRLNRLEKNAHAAKLSEVVCSPSAEGFELVDLPVNYIEQLNQRKLVVDTIRWLQQQEDEKSIVAILERVLVNIKAWQATFLARISSVVVSAATGASSFFRTPLIVPAMESQLQKILTDFAEDKQIFRAIFQVLSLTGDGSEQLKNQIIFEFMAQFVQQFLRKTPVEQMEIDPVLSNFLNAKGFFSYPSTAADELITLFKNEVQSHFACFVKPGVSDAIVVAS